MWIFEWAFDINIDPMWILSRRKYSRGIHIDTLWINIHPRKPYKFRGFDVNLT